MHRPEKYKKINEIIKSDEILKKIEEVVVKAKEIYDDQTTGYRISTM